MIKRKVNATKPKSNLFYIKKLQKMEENTNIIESNPEILGGKPIIKGTRIPVALIYELIGLNYSINDILKEYPHLDRNIILTLLKIGKDANENLLNVDIDEIISKEV